MILPRHLIPIGLTGKLLIPRAIPTAQGSTMTIYMYKTKTGIPQFHVDERLYSFSWTGENEAYEIYVIITGVTSQESRDVYETTVLRGTSGRTIPKGAVWISYRYDENDAVLFLTSDGLSHPSDAPYLAVLRAGPKYTPWETTEIARLGKLQNILGIPDGSPELGLAIGEDITNPLSVHTILGTLNRMDGATHIFRANNKIVGGINPKAGAGDSAIWFGGTQTNPGIAIDGNGNLHISDMPLPSTVEQFLYSANGGSLLLSSQTPMTGTTWRTSGGDSFTISGGVRMVSGPQADTRALHFLRTATNLWVDPLHENGVSLWGTPTNCSVSQSSSMAYDGTYSAKITASAPNPYVTTALSGTARSTRHAMRLWVATDDPAAIGKDVYLAIEESGGASPARRVSSSISLKPYWQPLSVSLGYGGVQQSDRTAVKWILSGYIASGMYFHADGVTVVNSLDCPDDTWGSLPGSDWTGTAHNSTSTSVGTSLASTSVLHHVNSRNTFSYSIRGRFMVDYDKRYAQLYFLNMNGSTPGVDEYRLIYSPSDPQFIVQWGSRDVIVYPLEDDLKFKCGDPFTIVGTHNWQSGEHRLYVNGVKRATTQLQIGTPSTLVNLVLGQPYYGYLEGGWALSEFVIYDQILYDDTVYAIHTRAMPLVDMVAIREYATVYPALIVGEAPTVPDAEDDCAVLYMTDSGGTKQFVVKFPDGTAKVLADDT